jgi:hypothetical protein
MTLALTTFRRTTGLALIAVSAALVGAEIVRAPSHIRLLAAACVGVSAIVLAAQWPRVALPATLVLLPYLALGRRVLLEYSPWRSVDPLLLLAPTVLALVLVRLYLIERRPLGVDGFSKLMLILLLVTVIEALNPRGGGLRAGATALLFVGVPLLWFFAGRELLSRSALRAVLAVNVVSAALIAVYGLAQTWHGLAPWDRLWVAQTNYTALNVGGTIRAFGTFSSSSEYSGFLGISIVAAVAFALDRRPFLLPLVPVIGLALFYESSRGPILTTLGAVLVVLAAKTGSMRNATISLVLLVGAVTLVFAFTRGSLQSAATSSDPLVAHQASGLLHPLSKQTSTLPTHLAMIKSGLRGALDPIGKGIASTNLAGLRYGNGTAGSTESDLSNEFVDSGPVGGFAYAAIVVLALAAALRHAVKTRDAVGLSVLGMLLVIPGQWLNGGYYAIAPLVWCSIGFVVAAESARRLSGRESAGP